MSVNRKKIGDFADHIRGALEMNSPPYDPKDAIRKLNGKIIYDISEERTDGYIEKIDINNFCIHLSNNKSTQRERFTLAHELGHLFLHMGFIIDDEKWKSLSKLPESVFYRGNSYSDEEYEANEFAASFLMPKGDFLDIAGSNLHDNIYNIEEIASCFDVSLEAVANRGKWLGIFQW
jgi:Zn-dependent peptidase ImmA (M78 family)